jgi:hypothetical protein
MEKAQSEVRAQTPYQVIREYRLFGATNSGANADVVAQLDFKPPTGRDYRIQEWSGSTRGKQIVQRVLDHETEVSKGNQARTQVTSDNYDFALVGEAIFDGRPCYVLGLKPKRKQKELVSGNAWVDKRSFFILHIEGESSKTPSWWLKSVRVKMSFGDFSGVWLQTSMEAVADVRLLGFHTLTSRILDYRGSDMSASSPHSNAIPRSRTLKSTFRVRPIQPWANPYLSRFALNERSLITPVFFNSKTQFRRLDHSANR